VDVTLNSGSPAIVNEYHISYFELSTRVSLGNYNPLHIVLEPELDDDTAIKGLNLSFSSCNPQSNK
jgi:hypothetical protein